MDTFTYPKIYLYRRVVQAKLFIDNRYAEKINLDDVASEASFSKYHFIRLFRQIYSLTPHQYLMKRRIEAARALLKSDRHTIIEVCFAVGFESVTSFISLFKKQCGISPKAFQLQHRKERGATQRQPLRVVPHCFARAQGWI